MDNLQSAGKYCKIENQWICWRKKQKKNWKIVQEYGNISKDWKEIRRSKTSVSEEM